MQEGIIPARALEFDRQRRFRGIASNHVECAASQDSDVARGVILAVARRVFAEGHIQLPMQGVFDGPMIAYGGEQCLRGGHPGQREEARLGGCLSIYFSRPLDPAKPLEPREIMVFSQCLCRNDNRFSRLLAAMSGLLGVCSG